MGFKVTLNMENDAELRAYVKDLVKGQVLSIAREEVLAFVKEELERKMKNMDKYNFEYMIKQAFKDAAAEHFRRQNYEIEQYGREYSQKTIKESVERALAGKDWKNLVEEAARNILKGLLK